MDQVDLAPTGRSRASGAPLVDSHVHFWDPEILPYPWLSNVPAIASAQLPEMLRSEASQDAPERIVFVQAECDRTRWADEVAWVERLARDEPRIAAIVAFAPLGREGKETGAMLRELGQRPLVRGVRYLIQDDPDPDLCRRAAFVDAVTSVGEAGLVFDLCARCHQLDMVIELVRRCPAVRFVLDHAGKPDIRGAKMDPWREQIATLAGFPNVVCKLSGLVTEADPSAWSASQLAPYVEHLLGCFAADRLLFGSDWPVLKLASTYARWLGVAHELTAHLPREAQDGIFSGNARRTYRIA